MSKKLLSRSILEGGRYPYNKWERRHSNRVQRSVVREYLSKIAQDPDWADEEAPEERKPVSKKFNDKLGPVVRWLESHIGEPWDDVHSEIKARFDTRTIAGQHIVYDHLIGYVQLHPGVWHFGVRPSNEYSLYVDGDGILRAGSKYFKRWSRYPKEVSGQKVAAWCGPRKVIVYPEKLFWTDCHDQSLQDCPQNGRCGKIHSTEKRVVRTSVFAEVFGYRCNHKAFLEKKGIEDQFFNKAVTIYRCLKGYSYRQGEEFSKNDYEVWGTLSEYQKKSITYFNSFDNHKKGG